MNIFDLELCKALAIMLKLPAAFLPCVAKSSDLKNGRCIKHEKYINRQVQDLIKWYHKMVGFFEAITTKQEL